MKKVYYSVSIILSGIVGHCYKQTKPNAYARVWQRYCGRVTATAIVMKLLQSQIVR